MEKAFPKWDMKHKIIKIKPNKPDNKNLTSKLLRMGMLAYTCNPSTLGGWDKWLAWAQVFETSLGNMAESHLYKIQKSARLGGGHLWSQLLGRLRWEDHLSPGGKGCSELRLCHCTPAWATGMKLHLKTKQNKTKTLPVSFINCSGWRQTINKTNK